MAKLKIKSFASKAEEIQWLVTNSNLITSQRKSEPKKSDSLHLISYAINDRGERVKSIDDSDEDGDLDNGILKIRCVINTTGLMDSHKDVHIPGIWKKSLSEIKNMYLCREHELTFEGIITDEVKAFTQTYTWKELGFDFEGSTEALVFDCIVKECDNEFMYKQYKNGKVKNHSVRMQYMKEYFCVNSTEPEYTQQKDNWDKYISFVANKDMAEQNLYFWAVTEAKIIEGSAVVRGSNYATPTLSTEPKNIQEPPISTPGKNEPLHNTQTPRKKIFIN